MWSLVDSEELARLRNEWNEDTIDSAGVERLIPLLFKEVYELRTDLDECNADKNYVE